MVVFRSYLRIEACLDVATKTYGLTADLGKFGKSVSVSIPGILGSVLAEYREAEFIVLRDNGGVDVGGVVEGRRTGNRCDGVGNARRVPDRFPGDDIDGAGDGRRAEKCRSAASHHLHPVHHIGRKLLDAIDSGQ